LRFYIKSQATIQARTTKADGKKSRLKKYHNHLMNKIYKLPYSSVHFKSLLTSHASDIWLKID